MTEQQAKRRGRPPKAPADRKDGNLTFRTRGTLRERLSEAATANGRSISEEVERRLEASFEMADTAAAARQAIDEAQDAFAVQAIHSTLEELQGDLGHPYALAVAMHMGQGFTAAHKKIRAETPTEIWFDNPDRMKEAAGLLHDRVDALFADWQRITYLTSFWDLFGKYRENILRKKADGTYVRRAQEARARREAEEAEQAAIPEV